MKFSSLIIFLLITLVFSCTANRYTLNKDGSGESQVLNKAIKTYYRSGEIPTKKPLIVLDGIPYRYEVELKDSDLPIKASEIKKLEVLKTSTGVAIYGDYAKGGVLLITSNDGRNNLQVEETPRGMSIENTIVKKDPPNIYVLVDGEEMPWDKVVKLDPNTIETLTVIKDKAEVIKYTDKIVDGVILIEMKK